jgi:hypothetical protein
MTKREMTNRIIGQIRAIGQLGLISVLLSIYGCTNTGTAVSDSDLIAIYRPEILKQAKKDFPTNIIEELKVDSSADVEAFRPYWLNRIKELKSSDSMNYVFYQGIIKSKYEEHTKLNQFPDSINLFKSELAFVNGKLDSANRGQFNNPILGQFERLSNEKGKVYFLQTRLKSTKDNDLLTLYFGVEELENDTIISWTTNSSLFHYVTLAHLRRNIPFWTKDIKTQQ